MIGARVFRNPRALMALAVAFASPAFGTDAMSEAQKRFDEGKALYRKTHDAAGARLKFAQAYALHPRPEVLWNLAICELDVGFAEDAAGHLRAYARDPDAKPALVAKVPDLLQTARESLGGCALKRRHGPRFTWTVAKWNALNGKRMFSILRRAIASSSSASEASASKTLSPLSVERPSCGTSMTCHRPLRRVEPMLTFTNCPCLAQRRGLTTWSRKKRAHRTSMPSPIQRLRLVLPPSAPASGSRS